MRVLPRLHEAQPWLSQTLAAIAFGVWLVLAYMNYGEFERSTDWTENWLYGLTSLFTWMLGLQLLLLAAWFAALSIVDLNDPMVRWKMNLLGRGICFLFGATLMLELQWGIVTCLPEVFPYRNYTICAIIHGLFGLILMARMCDTWHTAATWPVRSTVLGCVLIAMAFLDAAPVGKIVQGADGPEAELQWLKDFEARIDDIPPGPVVFVAASGGGSRAAMFAALVYDRMTHEIHADGTPVVHPTNRKDRFADRIALISSVSGGSLASTDYWHRYPKRAHSDFPQTRLLKNSLGTELIDRIKMCAASFYSTMERDLSKIAKTDDDDDRLKAWAKVKEACDKIEANSWPVYSAFADDMCTDFMAPLLRGPLVTGRERGYSVSTFWRDRFQWDRPIEGKRPLLLVNAAEVERGTRLVLGRPVVPPRFFAEGMNDNDPEQQKFFLEKQFPRSLADVDRRYELAAHEAARLSANFPWGFAVGRLTYRDSENRRKDVRVLDGGIVDNTGLDTFVFLLRALRKMTLVTPSAGQEKRKALAGKIMASLERRGILLVAIDSGAKQSPPSWIEKRFSAVAEPAEALTNAGYVNAQLAKELGLDESLNVLVRSTKTGVPVLRVPYTCNHSENVMTAWALGPTD
ncbi:MAG: hypothetical protein FJ303_09475 [Planctomycetes bacterium]|nr:hypothetical protein [Planctomycetota bacterium]